MSAGNDVLERKQGSGWSRGFDNLLDAELSRWFKTKMWWVQILVWTGLINIVLFMVAINDAGAPVEELLMLFNIFLGLFAATGVCIIMQGVIVGEKKNGTAEWVLSKPVSRQAFVLSKLIGNAIGITLIIVLVQGIIAFLIINFISGYRLQPLDFAAGLGIHVINLLFFVTLTLMLGTIFNHRAPVIGIPLVFLFSQQFIMGFLPELTRYLPWTLIIPPNTSDFPSVAQALMTGQLPYSYVPIATTLSASIIFIIISLWTFNRQEL